jgi:prepilin-type N-terminal cleavage/methylation domain-containing protein
MVKRLPQPRWMDAGFTLIELLVVLTIIGLVAGLAAMVAPQRLSGAQMARVEAGLIQWLKVQQKRAEESNTTVSIYVENNRELRSDTDVWQCPAKGLVQLSPKILTFFPDGSATRGDIIMRLGQERMHVQVRGLTGQIEAVR